MFKTDLLFLDKRSITAPTLKETEKREGKIMEFIK
jgi:hypothetical protein